MDLVAREGYLLDLDQGLDLTDAGEADQAALANPEPRAMTEKPLTWLRIEASDEARCDSLARFAAIDPEWKQGKKAMNDAEEALLEAQGAASERFPIEAYDAETSRALNGRIAEYDEHRARYGRLDSRRRVIQDEVRKLTDHTLMLLSESREPGIFDGGEKLGPDGWKHVKIRDLIGGPDPAKELASQVWPASTLEQAGYHTLGEYLRGRTRMMPKLIDDAELSAETMESADTAVYRFLEKRQMLDKWPTGLGVPNGQQMLLIRGVMPSESEVLLEQAAPEPGQPAPKPAPKPAPEPAEDRGVADPMDLGPPSLIGSELYTIATEGRKGGDYSSARAAAGRRVAAMLVPWTDVFSQVLEDDEDRPTPAIITRFSEVYGDSPAALLQRVFHDLWHQRPITPSPVSGGTTELFVDSAIALSWDMTIEGCKAGWLPVDQHEEVFGGFMREILKYPEERIDAMIVEVKDFSENLADAMAMQVKVHRKTRPSAPPKAPRPAKKPAAEPEQTPEPAPSAEPEQTPEPKKRVKAEKPAPRKKKPAKKAARS